MKAFGARVLWGLLCFLLMFVPGSSSGAPPQKPPTPSASIDCDRWLEIDLYWFDKDNLNGSVEEFWQRFAPLFQGVTGWKGIILNVGWLMDYVFDWRGNLQDRIPLPKEMKQETWFKAGGQLTGDTTERKRKWKERFADSANNLKTYYQDWTYSDLKQLADLLRQKAGAKYHLKGLRVGSFVLGWQRIYGGEMSGWSSRHPNAFKSGIFTEGVFNVEAKLSPDSTSYGAFPKGITEGLPIVEFFGSQWGHLSKTVGLDAIVLRDSVLVPGVYRRVGPYGKTAPSDRSIADGWAAAAANLVKATKLGNPQALVIGYSTAASAVADLRIDCVDLEAIAKEGYLDAWIDQTWAGAWNEVGVRQNVFWNCPYMGWTFQQAWVLLHAAIFAESKVRHYTLAETFDAWESWDILHTAPDRLKWGIWAYLHAAVKTPKGLKMPAGTYVSWANQGKRILSKEDVSFLATAINEATVDARQTREVFGPTLVYCREAMEWQQKHAPDTSIKEWIDDQAAVLMKWTVPISSVTRVEYLPQVNSDIFVVQTPVHLSPQNTASLARLMKSGQPVAVFASPAGGLDAGLARLIGIETTRQKIGPARSEARLHDKSASTVGDILETFAIFQPFTRNRVDPGVRPIYTVDGSPVLLRNERNGRRLLFWDPPELNIEDYPRWEDQPILARMGSAYPYVVTARALSAFLKGSQSPFVDGIAPEASVSLAAWRLQNGEYRLLAGNTEEGLSDSADMSRTIVVTLPDAWAKRQNVLELWSSKASDAAGSFFKIDLQQAECKLFGFH